MTVIGYVCVLVALSWILYKLYLAYNSAGGTIMVAVYDAAMYPPVLLVFGLYWVLDSLGIHWQIWVYVLIWLALAMAVGVAIRILEELGDRPL